MRRGPADPREAARRAALNALRRTRRKADRAGVDLSDWEGEFLGSVETRIQTYGRAFGDPEKGAPGQALSALQQRKLKEIAAKASGDAPVPGRRFGHRRPGRSRRPEDPEGGDEQV
ncbi:hypothetical protein [Phenylobacterium sp.]|uniref:hypothetical protein n=1 Tax=Phenylobacterium sp. TaxID=1871053 RepID=UPI0025FD66C9|nr:hypothetical protein [Phenylobacterium sp.]MCA3726183.1 hypothetical protein [Phenylobacterium sp.]MCA6259781.1 hypothetical protein [Phenylobacterium sp.]